MARKAISENAPVMPYCILSILSNQSMASGASVPGVQWTNEISDQWGMHTMPSGTTIVVNRPGIWLVTFCVILNVTPVGASTWSGSLVKTGVGAFPAISASTLMSNVGFNYYAQSTGLVACAANDALSVTISQNSGATGNVLTSSYFQAIYQGEV